MSLIRPKKIEEGKILYAWMTGRFRHNQNVLLAITGGTGSGKSYCNLRQAEIHYKEYFKESFPSENICFSIGELMKRLSSGKLRKGEIVILEEAGANYGSLDFQNKVSKLFSYVLQSFRSMNVALFLNLPVLSMLNKSARLLLHCHMVTCGFDRENNQVKVKPYFRQVNQQSGKIYEKYLRIKLDGRIVTVKKMAYSLPSKEIREAYEKKKSKFLSDLTTNFSKELDELDKENLRKQARNDLTDIEQETYNYLLDGLSVKEIAEKRNTVPRVVYHTLERIKNKGFEWKNKAKSLRKDLSDSQNTTREAV